MFRSKGIYEIKYCQCHYPDGTPDIILPLIPMDCCLLHDHHFLESVFWMWVSGAITEKKFKDYLLKNNLVPYNHRNAKKVIIVDKRDNKGCGDA
jgi:hypothetical protein